MAKYVSLEENTNMMREKKGENAMRKREEGIKREKRKKREK